MGPALSPALLIWSDPVKPGEDLTVFFESSRLPPGSRRFCLVAAYREVFPPEPPVAIIVWPERRGAVKGAPQFGAAKRTLDGEHRFGVDQASTGGVGGNTFLLVGSEPR